MRTKLQYTNMCLLVICMLGLMGSGVCQVTPDPCTAYTPLDDDTLLTTYTLGPGDPNRICRSMGSPGWYRYTTTNDGTLSTTCPTGTQCGTDKQIWINGSIPSQADGVKTVSLCMVDSGDCCRLQNSIQVKNCTLFMVFNLTFFPSCNRLCFSDTGRPTTTSPTTISAPTAISTPVPTGSSTPFLVAQSTTKRSRASPSPRFGFGITFLLPVVSLLMPRSDHS